MRCGAAFRCGLNGDKIEHFPPNCTIYGADPAFLRPPDAVYWGFGMLRGRCVSGRAATPPKGDRNPKAVKNLELNDGTGMRDLRQRSAVR